MKNFLTRQKLAILITVVATIALLMTGSFAYVDYSQHKANKATGGIYNDVTLNDKFTPPANWRAGDQPVQKEVSVTNNSIDGDPFYIRLRLKEYFEVSQESFYTIDGQTVLFATYPDGPNKGQFITGDTLPAEYTDFNYTAKKVGDITYWLTDGTELRNGIYGKQLSITGTPIVYGPDTVTKSTLSDQVANSQGINEYTYPPHIWGTTTATLAVQDSNNRPPEGSSLEDIHSYIKWNLGPDVVPYNEFVDTSSKSYWIADGEWAYWSQPLYPQTSTGNLLKSLELLKNPGYSFEYQIHIDMEAVTLDEFDKVDWDQMNDYYKNLTAGQTINSPEGFQTAISSNGAFSLISDLLSPDILTIKNPVTDLTIKGNGKTITTSKNRVLSIQETNNAQVAINGLNLTSSCTESDSRGLSLFNNDNLALTLANCNITAPDSFAMHIGERSNTGPATVTISNCTFSGFTALNIVDNNANIILENCTLIGTNTSSNASLFSAAIVVDSHGLTTKGQNNTITLKNCNIIASKTSNAEQCILIFKTGTAGNTVTFQNCTITNSSGTNEITVQNDGEQTNIFNEI